MTTLPVLIVGAGPTGLMMACQLARHGIPFRIIDKKLKTTQTSNATTLQTRTLEIFKQMGIVNDFLSAGHPCRSIHFHYKDEEFTQLSFDILDSIYPYIFSLSQATTELILEANLNSLNHFVEWQTELLSIESHSHHYLVTLKNLDGCDETIQCDYLLGCDGAHSLVRKHCSYSFDGDELKPTFFIVDSLLKNYLEPGQSHVFTDNGYMLVAFPLDNESYQLSGNIQPSLPQVMYTEDEVKQLVDERSRGKMSAEQVPWMSTFKIHSRMVKNMRKGNIFLLGDAAHIHSPTGGQGMNLGLQDAHNLAWKLALVIDGKAHPQLLDSYQIERYPVIHSVIASTKFFTRLLIASNPVILGVSKVIARLLLSFKAVQRVIARRFAQVDIRYHANCALQQSSYVLSSYPRTGERAPDVKISNATYLYDYLSVTHHHIIIFTGSRPSLDIRQYYNDLQDNIVTRFGAPIRIHIVTGKLIDDISLQIHDGSMAIHNAYHVTKPTIFVIRPDGYIAYKSVKLNIESLTRFFTSFLSG